MAGGRKFNIWIAYSDLFTNLSTLLFVSALGVFAALGSGVLAPPGWGGATTCEVSTTVRSQIEAGDSLWKLVAGGGTDNREGCTEYYLLYGFRFRGGNLDSFADAENRPPQREDLQLRICKPVWLAVANRAFENAGARLAFLGVPRSGNAGQYPTSCGTHRADDEWIDGFPHGRRPIYVISDCRLGGPTAYPICRRVLQCLQIMDENDRPSWCRSVWAADERARQADAACRRAPAEEQAKTLYDQCAGAIDSSFPDQEFEREGMRAAARRRDGRTRIWGGEASFDAVSGDLLTRMFPPGHPLADQLGGAILLRVDYDR